MSETVACEKLNGEWIQIAKSDLIFRPAVYGLIVAKGRILLLRMRFNGKLHLPGGGIEPGEPIEATLRREIREETGLEVAVGAFLHFNEIFFYYDPSGRAYHGLHFYYVCYPRNRQVVNDAEVHDSTVEKPRWMDISALRPEEFQANGPMILALIERAVKINARQPHATEERV